ncbi:MAG: DNA ligase [Rubrivivax sp. SCN 70-15]|nr:MAG: DNA ligase [Rubrivivax sp. SCN 70-15]
MAALAWAPGWGWARPSAPSVMLARDAAADIDPAGFLVSEKYDGVRAVWDGHTLRFRSGLPVPAPAWFTRRLPPLALDGELWLARGRFEALSGIVRKAVPVDADWRSLRYQLFDLPGQGGRFAERARRIEAIARERAWPQLVAVPQQRVASRAELQRRLDEIVAGGGEGLMLHRADAPWRAGRNADLLKLKPLHDAEAVVVGHLAGHGRHAGRLGALRVRLGDGRDMLIGTGFSDAERTAPPPIGATVTFTYRGTTAAGVPRFASYLRLREP